MKERKLAENQCENFLICIILMYGEADRFEEAFQVFSVKKSPQ